MRHIITLLAILYSFQSAGQPLFLDADNRPGQAYAADVNIGTIQAGPGDSGRDIRWDFSDMAVNTTTKFRVLKTQTAPFRSTYSTANYIYIIDSLYFHHEVDGNKILLITENLSSPGSSGDLAQNPRTIMEFLFNYQQSFTDTFKERGDTAKTVTVEYDAYGKLILPNVTYEEVARVKETYASGTSYVWYTEDPLVPVLRYDHRIGGYTHIAVPALGVSDIDNQREHTVYPNPANERVNFNSDLFNRQPAEVRLFNITGQLVHTQVVTKDKNTINISNLAPGMYVYKIIQEDDVAGGKFLKQ